MSQLAIVLQTGFAHSFEDYRTRIHKMADQLTDEQFWSKPYDYGNSFGNLVLHITGNLAFYIGTHIHQTGYVRDREREFELVPVAGKSEALRDLDAAVAMVVESLASQSDEQWSEPYVAPGIADVHNRFEMYLRCAAHFHHHIGQITYLVKEWTARAT